MKKISKVLALLLSAILFCFAFAGCGDKKEAKPESDLEKVKANGKFVVGITEFEPVDYRNEEGEWVGFDADLAREFAKSLGVEVEFKVIDWDNKFLELKTGAIDCVWNGMTITDEVKLNTAYTDAYAKNEQVVVISKDVADKYKTMDSLKDLTFAVEAGSAAEGACKDNGLKCTAVTSQADTLLEVKAGSTDAAVIDSTMAKSMTGEGTAYSNLGVAMTLTKEEYGAGFRKESDLQAKANEFIAKSKENGFLKSLSDKYGIAAAD